MLAVWMLGCGETGTGDALDDITLPDGVELPDGLDLDGLELPPGDTITEFADFGEPCEDDEECESGICIPGPLGQKVCSEGCDEECPPGWLCTDVSEDSNGTDFVCIPGLVNQCAQCDQNIECGGKVDQCTPIGEDGLSFCTQHCDVSDDCGEGYYCSPPGAGTGSQQCLPVTGECACPPDIDGTERPCQVVNASGVCYGTEKCDGPFGWTGCTATTPIAELCDGQDNDCDGDIDEDLPTDAECTVDCGAGSCPGVLRWVDGQGVCEAATPTAETCDGVDNDCNGQTDDGLDTNAACTVDNEHGSCAGVLSCVDGSETCDAATPEAEACDGQDNDCDDAIDEDLTEACANDCGDPGTAQCVNGVFTDCDAPFVEELCEDMVDNDCDGTTDEADCLKGLAEPGASLTYYSSYFHATNVVTDHGDGTYSQSYFGMTDPNATGTAWAKVDLSSINTSPLPWFVAAKPATTIQFLSAATNLYDDRRDTVLMAAIRDDRGRPANKGTVITFDISANAGVAALTCTTNDFGRCTATMTLPDAAFDTSQTITVTANGAGMSSDPITIQAHARPPALTLDAYQVGIELPVSPRWDGSVQQEEFEAYVYINTGIAVIGAYDFQVNFDKALLETVSVTAGSHPLIYGDPISNVGPVANSEGQLKFNTLNTSANDPDGKGPKVHVATIRFRTMGVFFENMSAAITGHVTSLYSTDFAPLSPTAPDPPAPIVFRDANGPSTTPSVDTQTTQIEGIFVSSPKSQLLGWYPLTGTNETTLLNVIGLRTDGTQHNLAQDNNTVYLSDNSTLLQVSADGTVKSQSPSATFDDWVNITVDYFNHSATQPIRVLVLGDFKVALSDGELQPIADHPAGLGQTAKLMVTGTWFAGSQPVATMDVTSMTSVIPSPGLIYKPILREFSTAVDGPHPFEVRGAVGNVLVEDVVTADSLTPATISALRIIAPCSAENVSLVPSTINVDDGTAELTVSVEARIQGIGSTCQSQVWAEFDDGARMRLTGDPAITVTVEDTTVATTTTAGKLTASTPGSTTVHAVLLNQGTEVVAGERVIQIDAQP